MQPRSVKEPVAAPGEAKSLSPKATPRAAYERSTMVPSFDKTEAVSAVLSRPDRYKQLFAALSLPGVISRGAGLSYCLASARHQGRSVLSTQFNRFLDFDAATKVVRVEPGVTMGELFEFAVARNLIPPVLPGYPLITVGGAVAANIHGKNQFHAGNFGDHVKSITLYHPMRGEVSCGLDVNPDLFKLTIGGFGLTGHITSVEIALTSLPGRSLAVERHNVSNLVEAGHLMERLSQSADYTYSWQNLNVRGRPFGSGTVYAERHVDEGSVVSITWAAVSATRPLPFRAYNRLTVPLLCWAYQTKEAAAPRSARSELYSAFFPFVGKEMYFRLYGKSGFREYQVLFPREQWEAACQRIADAIAQSGALIMLASIKTFRGERSLLNFSGDGICLALDTPNTPSATTLFARLDEITVDLGGIANISKDSRLSSETVRAMYGHQYEKFRSALHEHDPERHFQSQLRRRLDV